MAGIHQHLDLSKVYHIILNCKNVLLFFYTKIFLKWSFLNEGHGWALNMDKRNERNDETRRTEVTSLLSTYNHIDLYAEHIVL